MAILDGFFKVGEKIVELHTALATMATRCDSVEREFGRIADSLKELVDASKKAHDARAAETDRTIGELRDRVTHLEAEFRAVIKSAALSAISEAARNGSLNVESVSALMSSPRRVTTDVTNVSREPGPGMPEQ
jgi:hypothetical protein